MLQRKSRWQARSVWRTPCQNSLGRVSVVNVGRENDADRHAAISDEFFGRFLRRPVSCAVLKKRAFLRKSAPEESPPAPKFATRGGGPGQNSSARSGRQPSPRKRAVARNRNVALELGRPFYQRFPRSPRSPP